MPRAAGIKTVWNINKVDAQTTEVFIYDIIADKQRTDWWTGEKGTEVTPSGFMDELNKVTTSEICVRINSGGGDVFAAEAIRTAIRETRQKGKTVTCKIDGVCASAATGIALACEKVSIPASAWFMIHDPVVFAYGYFGSMEFQQGFNMIEKIKQGIMKAYVSKTGKSEEELSGLMTAEKWYTGDEAVEEGFCDEVMFEDDTEELIENPENAVLTAISMYRNVPTALLNHRAPQNSGGLSNKNEPQKKEGVKKNMDIKTVEDLTAAYPELTAQIANTATVAERKRIQDIEGISLAGYDGIVNKAKFDTPLSAADVAMQIIAEQKKLGTNYLADVAADVTDSEVINVKTGGREGAEDSKTNPYDAVIDSVLPPAAK